MRQILFWNSAALIGYRNFNRAVFTECCKFRLNENFARSTRIFQGVIKNIHKHLLEPVWIGIRGSGKFGNAVAHLYPLAHCAFAECEHGFVQFGKNIRFNKAQSHSSALKPAEIKKLFNKSLKPARLFNDNLQAFWSKLVTLGIMAVIKRFAPTLDWSERSSQFMGYCWNEIVFHFIGGCDFRSHRIYRIAQNSDFVIIFFFDSGIQIAVCDLICGFCYLLNGNYNWSDKEKIW